MGHQDFERYAEQRLMNGVVAGKYNSFFVENVFPALKKNFRALDYGCGDGKYFSYFNQFTHKDNIYGIEISQTRVRRCHQLGWNNVFKVGNFECLPFPDAFFDLINFDQVIEHIRFEDIPFYLHELNRVLVNGGLIVILTPNYPIKRFYDMYSAFIKRNILRIKDDPTHVTRYNFKKLKNLLSNYFNILKLEPTGGFIWEKLNYNFFSCKIIGLLQKRCQ
ncbi:MAG: hypothetical protein HW406_48 [Candidatus Brocadiaceae bacterium]|nr:hypothetical protein [Candidatus Brocadiaceae bacterium]